MRGADATRKVLLAMSGLDVGGGIASVSRCIARALDEASAAGKLERVDHLSLLDPTEAPPPLRGSQISAGGRFSTFALKAWLTTLRRRPDLVIVDHVGLARSFHLPLPGLPPRTAVFVHGRELDAVVTRAREAPIRRADLVLTNSEHTARIVSQRFPEASERVRTVLLCIDPGLIGLWESLPVPEQERAPAAFIAGRLWSDMPGKGHDALIEGWPKVVRAVPEAELWIAGDGDDRPRLEALARRAGVEDAVRFLGRISDEELSRRYRTASVFAMPSRQEGFGLVYAEAMWHGLPCIGSTADAAGDVIRDGETGLLVPYGDAEATAEAVASLLRDPHRVRAMGRAGARDARERFGYERFRRDLYAALEIAPPVAVSRAS